MQPSNISNQSSANIPTSQLIAVLRFNRGILKRLVKTKDPFMKRCLLAAMARNYEILGAEMPDVALLGTRVKNSTAA